MAESLIQTLTPQGDIVHDRLVAHKFNQCLAQLFLPSLTLRREIGT
jgi:hypothetical protein